MSASVLSVISRFLEEYLSATPQRLKLLDAYLLYILLTGALQFGYCLLVGTFPFNSFLSGFISCVGSFILAGNDSISDLNNNVLLWCVLLFPHSSLVAQKVKRLPTMWETPVWSLGWEDLLEKEMATHSSTLAWKILWTEELVRLPSTGSQRVGHDWATSLYFYFHSTRFCIRPPPSEVVRVICIAVFLWVGKLRLIQVVIPNAKKPPKNWT